MRLAIKFHYNGILSNWIEIFRQLMPSLEIVGWEEACLHPETIDFVFGWSPEGKILSRMTHLKAIISIAAGVDHITRDPECPKNIPIYRMGSPGIGTQMGDYVLWAALNCVRRAWNWQHIRETRTWCEPAASRTAESMTVGVMGLGNIGQIVARRLLSAGFEVRGWARSHHQLSGIRTYAGADTFHDFLKTTNILVCLLPATPETTHILNAKTFSHLPKGASIINVGRGSHLAETDLLDALDKEQIDGAVLDVFACEPLPASSRLWSHPKIIVTPHVAADATHYDKACHIIEVIKAIVDGKEGPLRYHPDRGY